MRHLGYVKNESVAGCRARAVCPLSVLACIRHFVDRGEGQSKINWVFDTEPV
jgi:hypothetical protein